MTSRLPWRCSCRRPPGWERTARRRVAGPEQRSPSRLCLPAVKFEVTADCRTVQAWGVRALSSAVVGCAADIAITAFNAGDLNLLFVRAGLGEFAPGSAYGKSALVSAGITPALRAADAGDAAVSDGLNEFVRLVAEKVAPRTPADEIASGAAFWRLREATRADGFDLRTDSPSARPRDGSACACCRWTSPRCR